MVHPSLEKYVQLCYTIPVQINRNVVKCKKEIVCTKFLDDLFRITYGLKQFCKSYKIHVDMMQESLQ